jgi:hypothetical protein
MKYFKCNIQVSGSNFKLILCDINTSALMKHYKINFDLYTELPYQYDKITGNSWMLYPCLQKDCKAPGSFFPHFHIFSLIFLFSSSIPLV